MSKCESVGCTFDVNPRPNNNDGKHCCRMCMRKPGVHGPACKGDGLAGDAKEGRRGPRNQAQAPAPAPAPAPVADAPVPVPAPQ